MKRRIGRVRGLVAVCVFAAIALSAVSASADGTETLGSPSIPIAPGNGVAVGGVGLYDGQPGELQVTVPADATVNQVLLYWEGLSTDAIAPDDTIEVNGAPITGTNIGGTTYFFTTQGQRYYSTTFRADITAANLIGAGPTTVTVGGLSFARNNGAGIMAIYTSPSASAADVQIVDGNDLAFRDFDPTLDTTVPQTFTFESATSDRVVPLNMFASSVEDERYRPTVVNVTSGGVTTPYLDLFTNTAGAEWDTVTIDVVIPAGATTLTVQALSDDHGTGSRPASFVWSAAALTVPTPVVPPVVCTHSQGYWKTHSARGPAPYDETWALLGEDNGFYLSGKSNYAVMWTPPAGNVYYNLAHQFLAAKLNTLAGATTPDDVAAAIASAESLFGTYTPAQVAALRPSNATRQQFISLADTLDDYNNGIVGPGKCVDDVDDVDDDRDCDRGHGGSKPSKSKHGKHEQSRRDFRRW